MTRKPSRLGGITEASELWGTCGQPSVIHNEESNMSMAHDPDDTLLTIKEVAAIVRAPEGTVRYWRFMGTGPRSIKVGKRVCFWKSDVLQWLEGLGG